MGTVVIASMGKLLSPPPDDYRYLHTGGYDIVY